MVEHWSIGDELNRLTRRRGYSLERLARESGVSKATIHRWMTGKVVRPYYWENLLSVAGALRLSKVETDRLLAGLRLPSLDTLASSATPEQQELMIRWTARARNNLPGSLTSFVGRQGEVLDIAELLSQQDVRLVTLTGFGGAGKTRLSLRVANELHDVFPDGIFFVSLATATDTATVISSIVQALDIRDAPGRSTGDRLVDYLRSRRMLLVLDNVEQVIAAAPDIVAMLESAEHLTVLVTSRVPLRVSCEHVRPVPLMELPRSDATLESIQRNDAVQLFHDRARAVNPEFALSPETAAGVAEICARLEGRPLAIELAAARCRQFSPEEMLLQFPSRLDLGADGPADLPDRQRSLRALIDWSYDLLSPGGQQLLRRLSIFSGIWSRRAMESVCGTAAGEIDELVEASLVAASSGERFAMLETIREYAIEQLTISGEEPGLREAHAAYYRELAGNRLPYVPLDKQHAWLGEVDREHDNIRLALIRSSWHGDDERVFGIAGGLWPYWHDYGHYREGLQWLELALSTGSNQPARLTGSVLTGACILSYSLSDIARARMYGEQALAVWRGIEDWHGVALTLHYLGLSEYTAGEDEACFVRAAELFQEGLAAWHRSGKQLGVAHGLVDLGVLSTITGQFEQAEALISQSRSIYELEGNTNGLARCAVDTGLLRLLTADISGAIEILQYGLALGDESGALYLLPWTRFYLGTSLVFAGEFGQAAQHLELSLRAHHENGTLYGVAYTLLGFAALRHREGRHDEAALLCGGVTAVLEATGITMNPAVRQIYERESQSVRHTLGEPGFERAYVAGRGMTADDAVRLALEPEPLAQP